MSVDDLKRFIRSEWDVPLDEQSLSFIGHSLETGYALDQFCLFDFCELQLRVGQQPPQQQSLQLQHYDYSAQDTGAITKRSRRQGGGGTMRGQQRSLGGGARRGQLNIAVQPGGTLKNSWNGKQAVITHRDAKPAVPPDGASPAAFQRFTDVCRTSGYQVSHADRLGQTDAIRRSNACWWDRVSTGWDQDVWEHKWATQKN